MAIDSPPAAIRCQAEGTASAAFPLTTTSSRPPLTSGTAAASASAFAPPLDLPAAAHQTAALVPQRAFPSLPPSGGDGAAYVPSEYASPMRVMMDIDRSEVTTTSGAPYDTLATTGFAAVASAVAAPGGGSYQQQLLQRQSSGGGGGPFSSSGRGSSGFGTTAAAAAAGALSAGLDPSSAARQVSLTVHRLLQLSTAAAGAAAASGTAAAAAAAETSCGLQVEVYSKLTELVVVTPAAAWSASLPALASAIAAAGGGGAPAAAAAATILASLQLASALASSHPEMMQVRRLHSRFSAGSCPPVLPSISTPSRYRRCSSPCHPPHLTLTLPSWYSMLWASWWPPFPFL